MIRYQYTYLRVYTLSELLRKAEEEGQYGWELLSVTYNGCEYDGVLKRPIEGEQSEPS